MSAYKETIRHNDPASIEATPPEFENSSKPSVFLGVLTPKVSGGTDGQRTFWERFKQLEKLLIGFRALKSAPEMRFVCLDGLSAFGDGPLSREELHQLMDLFQRNGVIGMFTAEEGPAGEIAEMEDILPT